jgi:hypothetical protein
LVEFAIVIGVVIVLAVGAIQSLYALYLTRQVRAAAEEIADLAAIHGGDAETVEQQIPAILQQHRLDEALAGWEIRPPSATYLETITVTLRYNVVVRLYGLLGLPIPAQQVLRLCEGG